MRNAIQFVPTLTPSKARLNRLAPRRCGLMVRSGCSFPSAIFEPLAYPGGPTRGYGVVLRKPESLLTCPHVGMRSKKWRHRGGFPPAVKMENAGRTPSSAGVAGEASQHRNARIDQDYPNVRERLVVMAEIEQIEQIADGRAIGRDIGITAGNRIREIIPASGGQRS